MAKKLTVTNDEALLITSLYDNGPMTGNDLMARTGIDDPEVIKPLVQSLLDKGIMGRDGKGAAAQFGLTEAGMEFAETEGLVETEEAAQTEEVEEEEFAAPAPARRAPPARTTSKGGATSKAAASKAPAARPTPQRTASKAAAPVAPARVAGKAATKGQAAEEEKAPAIVSYRSIDTLDRATLEYGIAVGEDTARAFMERGDEEDTAVATLIMRSVSKYKGQLRKRFGVNV